MRKWQRSSTEQEKKQRLKCPRFVGNDTSSYLYIHICDGNCIVFLTTGETCDITHHHFFILFHDTACLRF